MHFIPEFVSVQSTQYTRPHGGVRSLHYVVAEKAVGITRFGPGAPSAKLDSDAHKPRTSTGTVFGAGPAVNVSSLFRLYATKGVSISHTFLFVPSNQIRVC